MLTDLKTFLAERHCASLTEIARHLSADPDAVRPMLEMWVRKGKVRRNAGEACQGCVSCAAADIEMYEWVGAQPEAKPNPHH